jgi:hypothetical protein
MLPLVLENDLRESELEELLRRPTSWSPRSMSAILKIIVSCSKFCILSEKLNFSVL